MLLIIFDYEVSYFVSDMSGKVNFSILWISSGKKDLAHSWIIGLYPVLHLSEHFHQVEG